MSGIRLSIVIASHDAAAVIEPCLAALEPQCRHLAEVIVADSSSDATPELVARRFPWVRLLHFDRPLTVPELRGRAIAVAHGEIIAILDPFSIVAGDWAAQVLQAHERRPNQVIGGSVDLHPSAAQSFWTWVAYLNEYGLFMPPVREGETWIVPGSNVSYKRAALFDDSTPRHAVFWKTFANWEIERSGSVPWLAPGIVVALNKPVPFLDFLRTRYHHGRCFAGMRVRGAPRPVRIGRAASAPAIPAVLLWRWTRGFWPKRRHRLRFLLAVPAQLVLFGVWAWGEACGYLGGNGRSCEHLFY